LWLVGVENWGKPPFSQYGNLSKALEGVPENSLIILLTHDPSHWRAEVLSHPIALTLSGHTHAMQMGVEIGHVKWSPAKYIYPEYDGLYQQGKQYLYVNRGQGYLGLPGRIGMRPEITQFTLKNSPTPL
jgi:predicted MPP superfamily phosphohydrolase